MQCHQLFLKWVIIIMSDIIISNYHYFLCLAPVYSTYHSINMNIQVLWSPYLLQCTLLQQCSSFQEWPKPWLTCSMLHKCPLLARLRTSSLCRDRCLEGSFSQSCLAHLRWPPVVDQGDTSWAQGGDTGLGGWEPHLVEREGKFLRCLRLFYQIYYYPSALFLGSKLNDFTEMRTHWGWLLTAYA